MPDYLEVENGRGRRFHPISGVSGAWPLSKRTIISMGGAMDTPSGEGILKLALPWLSSGGATALFSWLLKRRLENRFTRELEKTKHELQLEQQKMSIVFEHQKDSFRKLLAAMDRALDAIERTWHDGEWSVIPEQRVKGFKKVVSEERLFLDSESDHAVQRFLQIMWGAVHTHPCESIPESSDVEACHTQMELISERLADHFRSRVGLFSEMQDPLLDITLLGACRLINAYHFAEFGLPTEGPLKFHESETAKELVTAARQNTVLLRSELMKLREAITSTNKSLFFDTLSKVDHYIDKLNGYKQLTVSKRRIAHLPD